MENIGILCVVCLFARCGEGGKKDMLEKSHFTPKYQSTLPLPPLLSFSSSSNIDLHVNTHTPVFPVPGQSGPDWSKTPSSSVTFRTISILIAAAAASRDSIPLSIQCFISGRRACFTHASLRILSVWGNLGTYSPNYIYVRPCHSL